jgi:hypothetical protein
MVKAVVSHLQDPRIEKKVQELESVIKSKLEQMSLQNLMRKQSIKRLKKKVEAGSD